MNSKDILVDGVLHSCDGSDTLGDVFLIGANDVRAAFFVKSVVGKCGIYVKSGSGRGGEAPRSMNSHEHAVASPNARITNTRIDDGTISLWMAPRNNNKCWIYVIQ